MLKVIIIDDEDIERNGLARNVGWRGLGLELAGSYENGRDALEAAVRLNPDIVITDIRMPVMDGLELSLKIKQAGMAAKIIILSGYDDFQYAKKAIEVGAVRYLLKPYELKELEGLLSDVARQCEDERREKAQRNGIEDKIKESMPLLRGKFCRDLVAGAFESEEEARERSAFLDHPLLEKGFYCACAIDIRGPDAWQNPGGASGAGMAEELARLIGTFPGVCASAGEMRFAALLSAPDEKELEDGSYDLMRRVRDAFLLRFAAEISAGIGGTSQNLLGLKGSYEEALEALQYNLTTDESRITRLSDVIGRQRPGLDELSGRLGNEALAALMTGDRQTADACLDKIFEAFRDFGASGRVIQNFCIGYINLIERRLISQDITVDDIFGKGSNPIGKLLRFDTIADIRVWLKNVTAGIHEYLERKSNSRGRAIAEQIKNIVAARYGEDLTVSQISRDIYMSGGYATSLFKKETGLSIMDYIIRIRINEAKKLLNNPTARICDVSRSVGYNNVAYFSSLFRAHAGMSPKEFRERNSRGIL